MVDAGHAGPLALPELPSRPADDHEDGDGLPVPERSEGIALPSVGTMTFGLALRRAREGKAASQRELADALGISQQYLSALERGDKGKGIKHDFIAEIAETLGYALDSPEALAMFLAAGTLPASDAEMVSVRLAFSTDPDFRSRVRALAREREVDRGGMTT